MAFFSLKAAFKKSRECQKPSLLPKPSSTIATQPCSNLHNTVNQSTDAGAADIQYDEIEFMDCPKDLEGTNFNCYSYRLLYIIQHKTAPSPVEVFKINSVVTVTSPSYLPFCFRALYVIDIIVKLVI